MQAMWQVAGCSGPWLRREDFPDRYDNAATVDREVGYRAHALLRVADGTELGSLVWVLRSDVGADWLNLSVYRGMQDRAFGVVYGEHFRQDNPWFDLIEAQYLTIADMVYASALFDLASIHLEGMLRYAGGVQVNIDAQLVFDSLLLPPTTMARIPDWEDWIERPSGLFWLPPRAGWD
jgi:hypothetical protein